MRRDISPADEAVENGDVLGTADLQIDAGPGCHPSAGGAPLKAGVPFSDIITFLRFGIASVLLIVAFVSFASPLSPRLLNFFQTFSRRSRRGENVRTGSTLDRVLTITHLPSSFRSDAASFADATTETQDNFGIVAQFAPLPPKESSGWPIIASVLGGLALAGLVLLSIQFVRSTRREPA